VEISLNSIEYLATLGGDFDYLNREILGHRAKRSYMAASSALVG